MAYQIYIWVWRAVFLLVLPILIPVRLFVILKYGSYETWVQWLARQWNDDESTGMGSD